MSAAEAGWACIKCRPSALYLEGKPALVLGGTGLSSDNMGIHEPYIYSRRLAELRFYESVEELADKVCFLGILLAV
jgi:hypothetical protein